MDTISRAGGSILICAMLCFLLGVKFNLSNGSAILLMYGANVYVVNFLEALPCFVSNASHLTAIIVCWAYWAAMAAQP